MAKFPNALLVSALFSLPAAAQSLNIDIGAPGSPYGLPPATYGAAAGSPGVWNDVTALPALDLLGLDGAPTNADFAVNESHWFSQSNHPNSTGNEERLLDDSMSPDDSVLFGHFTGLEPGDYDIYLLSVEDIGEQFIVDVAGSPDGDLPLGGHWQGIYMESWNYTRHRKSVVDGTIDFQIVQVNPHSSQYIRLAGIQLVRTAGDVGEGMCFGDGTSAACPCSNAGWTGRGCQNSFTQPGVLLTARGTVSPDTVVLHSTGELPGALTIFLQGTANIAPVNFGDGVRCTGGPLLRLFVKNASGGVVTAPAPGDLSITARAAALGQPIDPTDRRYYQAYYRDPNTAYCSPPQGANFNASQMLKITW